MKEVLKSHPEPAWVVFQGKIESAGGIGRDLAEGLGTGSHADAKAERKPALADLGLAGKEAESLGENARNEPGRLGELHGKKLGCAASMGSAGGLCVLINALAHLVKEVAGEGDRLGWLGL